MKLLKINCPSRLKSISWLSGRFFLPVLIVTLMFSFGLTAQPSASSTGPDSTGWTTDRVQWNGDVDHDPPEVHKLLNKLNHLLPSNTQLLEIARRESPLGTHITYQPGWDSIPLYRAMVKLREGNRGMHQISFTLPSGLQHHAVPDSFPEASIADTIILGRDTLLTNQIDYQKWWVFEDRHLKPAISLVTASAPNIEQLLSLDGHTLDRRNLVKSFGPGKDTTVKVSVFYPDPITSAMTTYGAPYVDNDDQTNIDLDNELFSKPVKGLLRNDSFLLENDFLKFQDLGTPNDTMVWQPRPVFDFTRDEEPFEAVNVYFHATRLYDGLSSLGFPALLGYQVPTDPRGYTTDNSSFIIPTTTSAQGILRFGVGGIDDGEDADVIVHEFMHAVTTNVSPATSSGFERLSLEEGICDYFAASYSRAISQYQWQKIFNWDGHNTFWPGRQSKVERRYPEQLSAGNLYASGELWVAPMMALWENIGRRETDKLMTAVLFDLYSDMKIGDALTLLMQADSILNGGTNARAIDRAFAPYGYDAYRSQASDLDDPERETRRPFAVDFTNISSGFLRVISRDSAFEGKPIQLRLFNTNGQQLWSDEMAAPEISSNPSTGKGNVFIDRYLPPGVYLLSLRAGSYQETIKIVR